MRDDSSGTPSEAPRKMRFKPKVPPRKVANPSETTIKAPQAEEDNNEYNEWQKLVKDVSRRRGPKSEKKKAPMQVAFGYGNTSVSARSDVPKHPTAITRANHQVFTDASASSCRRIEGKEYVEPWDYYSYYPVTLPVRRPYSGNPELLDKEDFGEDSINLVHDETHINPAAELEMMEEKEEEQMFFFQLPASLPLEKRSATEKGKEKVDITNSSWERGISAKGCKVEELPAGFMGKLLVYKSGAVKMKLGDALFDVSPSLNCTFAQEVAAINTEEKHCCILGELNKRVSVIPDMDFLLDNAANLD